MDVNSLVNLSARAWAIPILAHFHDGVPGRQAALLHATGAGRTAFAQSLGHLVDLQLIERNPGHGHPLRPEFRLTADGEVAARLAAKIQAVRPVVAKPLRRAWTLPILAVSHAPQPFSGFRQKLSPITDRALSQSLRHLQEYKWISRDVDVHHTPPRPYYTAANTGRAISEVLQELKL